MNPPKVRVGTIYLLAAQSVFLVSGYVMHIVLGRHLGPAEYGLFGVVLYAAAIIRTFVSSGFPMAVAKFVSAVPERAESIFRKSFSFQLLLAVIISLTFFIFAPNIARLLGDDALIPLFQVISPIPIFFGTFFLVIQYYNGLRRYLTQSGWLTISYILRAALAIGLAVAGFHVFGAVVGIVLASAVVSIAILITRKKSSSAEKFAPSELIYFSAPLIISSISHAFLMDLDLMFVKRLVPDAASTGYYTSAKALAQAIPFAFFALSGALYPAVSRAYSANNMQKLKNYIEQANRLLIAVVLPLIAIITIESDSILVLFFGGQYLPGAAILRWLIISFSLLAIFIIHKTVITGCGYPKISSFLTISLLPFNVILLLVLIPRYGFIGAAVASTITFSSGVLMSTLVLYRKFNCGFNLPATFRILIAVLFVITAEFVFLQMGLNLFFRLFLTGSVYLLALRFLGELRNINLQELITGLTGTDKSKKG
ncbi:hypothetical protein CEE37_03085 [candidate division LCP-89 bacterium B3_LCP]|uniref:Uncharacterized protein n=1 Tax=candidate division LCP-89 bacterium B3_LCP TaxID=2012998 RepID=A0A532V2X1_UNCL8|nr:MAG: hypothetical protein CEE37_03085 [candidate division LCP-89 bacterium B3_LCP]